MNNKDIIYPGHSSSQERARFEAGRFERARSGAIGGKEGAGSKHKKGPLGYTPRSVVPARLTPVHFGVEVELWVLVNNGALS